MESRSSTGVRVLVADRQRLFCEGIVPLLQTAPGIAEVCAATTREEAVAQLASFAADVVVFHPALDEQGPLPTARELVKACRQGRLLFLDDRVRPIHVRIALEAGPAGYWTKHAALEEIAGAIRMTAAGQMTFCPAVQPHVLSTREGPRIDPASPLGTLAVLTSRELEVFLCVAQGFPVRDCAQMLGISESTVDNHKARLMRKLRVHKAIELTWLAIREGMLP